MPKFTLTISISACPETRSLGGFRIFQAHTRSVTGARGLGGYDRSYYDGIGLESDE
jgi:hypothetical protein